MLSVDQRRIVDGEITKEFLRVNRGPRRQAFLRMKWYTKTGHGGGRNWTGYMIR